VDNWENPVLAGQDPAANGEERRPEVVGTTLREAVGMRGAAPWSQQGQGQDQGAKGRVLQREQGPAEGEDGRISGSARRWCLSGWGGAGRM